MTDRPIIMSAESVRAILDGRKTMTRRVIVPQPLPWCVRFEPAPFDGYGLPGQWIQMSADAYSQRGLARCKYGSPGDRLWVKEKWRYADKLIDGYDRDCPYYLQYEADGTIFEINGYEGQESIKLWEKGCDWSTCSKFGKWRAPLFMPRWASRIMLEITGIRVERLQDISEEDAKAEGAAMWFPKSDKFRQYTDGSYRNGFHDLWDSLNAKRGYPWSSNPWVWVIEFKRVEVQP